ncbi:hypothetical protein [Chitinophaga arvensicola]|uniref:Uncharacterized protein n=1 Tax=Chitinophaga arvensicola TaxID=29529 RepID=A0A1I0S633_9BACT|nr:hypothetical protein [Chitinophaga arvensicola]SEW50633.1 hypothetical protein SAMN04488122_3900 [Chitinophaga arvensicola]
MTNISIKVLTHKDYRAIFGISIKTAKTWISEDRKKIGSKRITDHHLKHLYGLSLEPERVEIGAKRG